MPEIVSLALAEALVGLTMAFVGCPCLLVFGKPPGDKRGLQSLKLNRPEGYPWGDSGVGWNKPKAYPARMPLSSR